MRDVLGSLRPPKYDVEMGEGVVPSELYLRLPEQREKVFVLNGESPEGQ